MPQFFIENPPHRYGASAAIWNHTVLSAIRHRWTRPALTPVGQAGTQFAYPGGMEGWVAPGVGYTDRDGSPVRGHWQSPILKVKNNHLMATDGELNQRSSNCNSNVLIVYHLHQANNCTTTNFSIASPKIYRRLKKGKLIGFVLQL